MKLFKSTCLAIAMLASLGMSSAGAAPLSLSAASSAPVVIDDVSSVTSTLNFTSHGSILDINALLNISHNWTGDLVLSLSHGVTTVVLASRLVGVADADFTDTLFDDQAAMAITAGDAYAPYTGAFRPEQALAAFIGQDIFGAWTLTVTDAEAGDSGLLNNWSLLASVEPLAAQVPEPASAALFALGLLGMHGARRRKQAK